MCALMVNLIAMRVVVIADQRIYVLQSVSYSIVRVIFSLHVYLEFYYVQSEMCSELQSFAFSLLCSCSRCSRRSTATSQFRQGSLRVVSLRFILYIRMLILY